MKSPLHKLLKQAIFLQNQETAKTLLEQGADPNIIYTEHPSPPFAGKKRFSTLLHLSVTQKNYTLMEILLSYHANPNILNDYQQSPLHIAASLGDMQAMILLFKKGGHLALPDKSGNTPLHAAACEGHIEIVRFLLEQGCSPNIVNQAGDTPLHLSACEGHTDIVRLLLITGANPNALNNANQLPLYFAANEGHIEVVHFLLAHGANLSFMLLVTIIFGHELSVKNLSKEQKQLCLNAAYDLLNAPVLLPTLLGQYEDLLLAQEKFQLTLLLKEAKHTLQNFVKKTAASLKEVTTINNSDSVLLQFSPSSLGGLAIRRYLTLAHAENKLIATQAKMKLNLTFVGIQEKVEEGEQALQSSFLATILNKSHSLNNDPRAMFL